MFIDSHCHLDFDVFRHDRDLILASCADAGVSKILMPGVSPEQWERAADLCSNHQELVYAVGLHPWWLNKTKELEVIAQDFLRHVVVNKCVAIGECGLDCNIDVPLEQQLAVFNWHLKQAQKLAKPVIIHSVKAHHHTLGALQNFPGVRGVVHAFSGSYETGMAYWEKGFYLGIGGTISYERAHKTRNAVAKLPLEALLLETDAPDMPLQGKQGSRNTPENLPLVAQILAHLKNRTIDTVATQTSANFQQLFQCRL